jgi:hypothetical protein
MDGFNIVGLVVMTAVVVWLWRGASSRAKAEAPTQLPPPGWPQGVPYIPPQPQRSVVGTTLKVVLVLVVLLLSPFILLSLV